MGQVPLARAGRQGSEAGGPVAGASGDRAGVSTQKSEHQQTHHETYSQMLLPETK